MHGSCGASHHCPPGARLQLTAVHQPGLMEGFQDEGGVQACHPVHNKNQACHRATDLDLKTAEVFVIQNCFPSVLVRTQYVAAERMAAQLLR